MTTQLPLQHLLMARTVGEGRDDPLTLPETAQLAALYHIISLASFLLSPRKRKRSQKSSEGEGDHISAQ